MDAIAWPVENYQSFEGIYSDGRDLGYSRGQVHRDVALWAFISGRPDADVDIEPTLKNVSITHCTLSGFDACLTSAWTSPQHVHVAGVYRGGYYFIRRQPENQHFLFVYTRRTDVAVGIGRCRENGGISAFISSASIEACVLMPSVSYAMQTENAAFPATGVASDAPEKESEPMTQLANPLNIPVHPTSNASASAQ